MEIWAWGLLMVMGIIVTIQGIRICLLKKAAREIERAFAMHVQEDTNILIDISSRDKTMRQLAGSINRALRALRAERQRYILGDRELKGAVTGISHDLRTPLAAICGYLDLLETEEKSPQVARYLEIIAGRIETLRQLTEELFRYSIVLSGETAEPPEPVVLNHAVQNSLAAFYATLVEAGITPVVELPEKEVVRTLDRAALMRVLANLLANAIKYSDGDLAITLKESGHLYFTNSASRLDEVAVGRLFDRFYTVESARGSTGLGLAIAKTLVARGGGTIEASLHEGRLTIELYFADTSE